MTATLAETYPQFLDDLAHNNQLRPNTLRAYRYELAAAAADSRFLKPLSELAFSELESWIRHGRPGKSSPLPAGMRTLRRQGEAARYLL